jgi:nucleotidyltransferase/DNA polymerase involved in DNA repair
MPTPKAHPRLFLGHLDADTYYVSAERVRFPFLRGQPLAVLGNQGACVIARSAEMKQAGVQVGEPIWEAKAKCPDGIYLKRDFQWYEVLSRKMLEVLRTFSPAVEYYSIDEFFFAVHPAPGQNLPAYAASIRDRIMQEVKVPVTVGLARTKSLAKLISDHAKPFGASAVIDPKGEAELLARRSVADITGIAKRRARRLNAYGIWTCRDFARADSRLIRQLLTVTGERLWWELNGQPCQPLHTQRPAHKMLARGGSLGETTADPDRVWAWAVRNLERLIEELDYHQVHAGRLAVWLGCRDDFSLATDVKLDAPTARFDLLLEALQEGIRRTWVPGRFIVRMNLIASDLHRRSAVQLGLFDPPPERDEALAAVKRQVNARIGRFKLRSGATLPLKANYDDPAQCYDICDVRGKQCF